MDVCMYGWVTSFFGFGGCLLKEERRDLLSLGNFLFLGGKAREQNFAKKCAEGRSTFFAWETSFLNWEARP